MLFGRAVLAFIALPGVVAYLIPLLMAPARAGDAWWRWAGAALAVTGTTLLLWCVRDFHVAGKGTLAPWSPPQDLVVIGLYRASRNPMYISVLAIVLGWSVWFASRTLLAYAAVLAIIFHTRILVYEEPRLEKAFGDEWRRYADRVPRWLLRGR